MIYIQPLIKREQKPFKYKRNEDDTIPSLMIPISFITRGQTLSVIDVGGGVGWGGIGWVRASE